MAKKKQKENCATNIALLADAYENIVDVMTKQSKAIKELQQVVSQLSVN